jgi:F-type H+-transporting ATPase subunit alpha
VLLTLTAELFDAVPLDQMTDAEHAVREAAAGIPAKVRERLDTAEELSDDDRETIIQIARKSLEEFSPEPDSTSGPKQETEEDMELKAKPKSEPKPKAAGKEKL